MHRRARIAGAAVLAIAAAACSPLGPADCTRIGCLDGLTVQFTGGAVPAGATVRALVGDVILATAQCPPAGACSGVFLPDVTAAQVTVEVLGGAAPLRWTLSPAYERLQPNGPRCGPVCRQARVELRID